MSPINVNEKMPRGISVNRLGHRHAHSANTRTANERNSTEETDRLSAVLLFITNIGSARRSLKMSGKGFSNQAMPQSAEKTAIRCRAPHGISQYLHLIEMFLGVFRDNPKHTIPTISLYDKSVSSKSELGTDVLARPEKFAPLSEHHARHALDYRTKCLESHRRNSKAYPFIVFLCLHGSPSSHSNSIGTEYSVQVTRFNAFKTAFTDANSIFVSTPAPQRVLPSANLIWM